MGSARVQALLGYHVNDPGTPLRPGLISESRPQVSAQVSTLSAQLAANLQEMGMANITVDSLSSTVVSYGPSSPPAITDAAAAAVGVLGSLLLLLICAMAFRRPTGPGHSKPEPPLLSTEPPTMTLPLPTPRLSAQAARGQAALAQLDSDTGSGRSPGGAAGAPLKGLPQPVQPYILSADIVMYPVGDAGCA
jgi:hypothetical protein